MDKAPLCSINHCLIWEAEFQTLHFSELISRRGFCGTYFVAGSMRSSSNPFLDLLSSKVTCDRGCRFDGNKIHTFRGTRNTNVRSLWWILFSCLSSIPWTRVPATTPLRPRVIPFNTAPYSRLFETKTRQDGYGKYAHGLYVRW